MSNGKSVVYEFKIKTIADIKDVQSNMQEIQKMLSALSLPKNLQAQFEKTFGSLEKDIATASKILASGFKTKGDVTAYEKAINAISAHMKEIGLRMKEIDTSKLDFKVDQKKIEGFLQTITKVRAELDKIKEDSFAGLEAIAKSRPKGAKSWTEFLSSFQAGDIEGCEKAFKALNRQIEKAKADGRYEKDEKWKQYEKDVNAYGKALAILKGEYPEYIDLQKQLLAAMEAVDKAQEEENKRGVENIEKATNAMPRLIEETNRYTVAEKEAGDAAQKLGSQLERFKTQAAYFFGLTNAVNLFKRAVRSAFETVKDLDDVMTQTAVVTKFDVGDMWDQLPEYTRRANELGVSIHDAYEAATLYYQQGLKTNEVMAVSNETLKMARIAGLNAADATSRMTNALRGFNMEINEGNAQRVNDVYSELAAITAADTDEISRAMTKVASLAHNANMEFETTSAFLAQVIETTRESAETAGTALKTVIARFSEVKDLYNKGDLMGTDEEGEEIDVNKVSVALRSAGINLNEYLTGAKGLDDIFIELASKWQDLDMVQQRYIATMAAGSRQQSRFIAMMSDYKRTTELVTAANTSAGASQKQFEKTLDSLKSKLAQLKNSWDTFLMGISNNIVIKGIITVLTKFLDVLNNIFKQVDKLPGVIGDVAGSAARLAMSFAGMKLGGKLVDKLIKDLANKLIPAIGTTGKVAGETFLDSMGKAVEKSSDIFSKKFWKGFKVEDTSIYDSLFDKLEKQEELLNDLSLEDETRNAILKDREEIVSTLNGIAAVTNTVDERAIILQAAENNATLKEIILKGELTEEMAAEVVLRQRVAALSKKNIFSIIATTIAERSLNAEKKNQILMETLLVKRLNGNIFATQALTMAELLHGKALAGILVTMGLYVAAIGAIIAATWLLISSYKKMRNQQPDKIFERAEESAESATNAAEELTNSYNNLNTALKNLDDKYSVLESLTRGTQDWKDAVAEINNEILDLMENYSGLVIKNEDGVLKIVNEEELRNQISQRATTAQAARIGAQSYSSKASVSAEYGANSTIATIDKRFWSYIENYPILGELYKLAAPFVGGGAVAYNRMQQNYYDQSKGVAERLAKGEITGSKEDVRGKIEAEFKSLGILKEVTDDVVQELRQYGQALIEIKEQTKQYYDALANTVISSASLIEGTEKQSSNFLNANRMESFYIDSFNELIDRSSDSVKKELVGELGYDTVKAYEKENGALDEDSARQQLAYIKAQKKATIAVEAFSKNIQEINPIIGKIYSDSNGAGLTKNELEVARGSFSIEDYEKAFDKSLYVQQTLYGQALLAWNELSDEQKNMFGSMDDFARDYMLSVINTEAAFKQADEKLKLTGIVLNGVFNELTGKELENVANKFAQIYVISGKEGAEQLKNELDLATKDMAPEEAKRFISLLSDLDWTNLNELNTLPDLLDELGDYDIDVKQLQNHLIELGKATKSVDLETLTEQVKQLSGISAKIHTKEQGRSGFTQESVDLLLKEGLAQASDFQYNALEEEWIYVGKNLDEFANTIDEFITKDLLNRSKLQEQIDNGEIFNSVTSGKESNINEYAKTVFDYLNNGGTGLNRDAIHEAFEKGDAQSIQFAYETIKKYSDLLQDNTTALVDLSKQQEISQAMYKETLQDLISMANGGDEVAGEAIRGRAAAVLPEDLYFANSDNVQALGELAKVFEEAKEFELDIDNLNDYTKQMKTLGKTIDGVSVELDDVTAAQLALANTKQNAGMKKLVDSYEEWTKLIDEDGQLMTDLDSDSNIVLENLKNATNELLNTAEPLSKTFWKDAENLDLVKQAAEGSTSALIELRNKAAEDYLVSIGVIVDGESLPSEMTDIENWLIQNAPTLEVGTVIDTGPFIQGLNQLIEKTGMSVDELQAMFDALGFDLDVDYVDVKVPKWRSGVAAGVEMLFPDGEDTIKFPRIKSAAYKGGVGSGTTFASPSSGSGGSSGSEKTDTWENPYDELYNLTEKINEALRTREELERRYEKLVKKTSSTVSEVTKGYYDQIRHLRTEADLQKQMLAGRARQIDNVANEMYMDSEGNRSSFADLGVTKYASYNKETGVITIDWESLEALEGDPSKVEEGKAAEAYISRLEELQGQYEEVRDKLWDIEDEIERLREEAIESYLSFEDRVMDDLVTHYQNQIDELSNLYDAIDQSTNEIIKGIQEEINYSRQIRDNTKKEEDIADKEARLAYLRRDTSGANAMEIKKLEEDIANSREQYSDTMVDQQIADMQNEAQLAAEQRQHQIEIMQNQLDVAQKNGELWGKVWELINTATAADGTFSQNSELVNLMKETEAYESLSVVGQQKWWEDAAEAFLRAQSGLSEAEGKYGVDANGDGSVSSASSSANSSASSSSGSASASGSGSDISTEGAGHFAKVGTYEHPMAQMPSNEVKELQQALNDAGFTDNEDNTLKTDGIYGSRTRQAVWKLQEKLGNVKVDGYYGPETRSATLKSQFKAFATGGLADFTGPAWLDGTKSSPELVLNAKDTENFIALKNILANLLGGQGGDLIGNKGGDNYFDIHIDAEIGSDYDVDRLAEKIEKKIYEKSSYRNVNAINYLR